MSSHSLLITSLIKRQTLLEDTNNCCILLTSTRDMVSTMVQLHTLTLTLRKHVRNAAERAAVGETKADLSILLHFTGPY